MRGLLVLVFLMWANLGHAQQEDVILPLLDEETRSQWRAVGVVNFAAIADKSLCSGTLVGADLVLTAAHCVMGPNGQPRSLDQVHFVAGWDRGEFVAHSKARAISIHPAYLSASKARKLAFDVAVIRLQREIATEDLRPLPVATALDIDADHAILGYHQSRPHILNGRFDCDGTTYGSTRMYRLDCNVIGGNSGAPVLSLIEGKWHVTAVVAAKEAQTGPGAAIAVPLGQWVMSQIKPN